MSYYLVILFFLASCSILGMFKIDKKLEYSLLFISFLALFLFSGLRYDVGMDYSSYEQLYKDSLFQLNPEIKELGWAYLFYWCRNIGISFSIIILLISFFTIYCVFVFIRRYSPYPFLSILIFFLLCTILYIYLQCN
ncbi:EpsG family protein [Bacteroides thetaiotaomicron]|uniref:EpsG family protein n=1 Tax=Bacteroides thetaiotaomicron TaxID=818 RepID=UPI0039C063E8